jgi:aminobenzoyl-glutamate transport protein
MSAETQSKRSGGILGWIERAGNALPDPVTIFLILMGVILVLSAVLGLAGVSATHPVTEASVSVTNLLSGEYLRSLLTNITSIFINFPPLGLVLVVMIGAGLAERVGLFAAGLRGLVRWVPGPLLTSTLVFGGVMGNLAVDAGYVVLIPLGGVLFAAAGRHPVAGIAATFAGVSAGFSANLIVTPLEPLLLGISQAAGQFVDPELTVDVTGNMWFVMAMTPIVVIVGTLVTEWIVEPRLGKWTPPDNMPKVGGDDGKLGDNEKRGLRVAGLALLLYVAAILALALPPGAPLQDPEVGLANFSSYIVALTTIGFLVVGLAYGFAAKTVKDDKEAVKLTSDAMGDMGGYIVLAFAMAIFLNMFGSSNLGTVLAISGASALQGVESAPLLLIAVVLLTAVLNLFVGSASAKWTLLAPVVVPMFMLLGISPEASTAAYRIGDGATNIITPLMPYLPMVLVFAKRYAPEFGLGSLIATMLPYSIAILISLTAMFTAFLVMDWPLGWDGARAAYDLAAPAAESVGN